ncbi:DNA-binding transcriptional regulator, XRE-family HTH domain [Desulfotomaculum arcticum]|uniref:DNA-binding transcriptional regulator, XRE-family HTH domain n=1 Tax=Desulfotruncus arcticus DSM 17038 TaxID=1121424 RepID=A0A1I2P051_9FIRM|nr:helix-turn-helix transcriptional regulator [Desulfotruncus arcticus]SFG07106.1 DNA-binding transcriptional regulator, XRE-family HTH domain [Desulfotomaculum arcticum] [Desulfotruncus arcticus DSM 17038]
MTKPKWTLAELRKQHEPALTQRELAARLNIPASTIGMYEIGKRVPGLPNARAIARFFGVATDDIFFGPSAHRSQNKP